MLRIKCWWTIRLEWMFRSYKREPTHWRNFSLSQKGDPVKLNRLIVRTNKQAHLFINWIPSNPPFISSTSTLQSIYSLDCCSRSDLWIRNKTKGLLCFLINKCFDTWTNNSFFRETFSQKGLKWFSSSFSTSVFPPYFRKIFSSTLPLL